MAAGEKLLLTIGLGAVAATWLVADHGPSPFDAAFDRIGRAREVPPLLLKSLARVESGFNPSAVSPPNTNGTRDRGLMQINDRTAQALGRDPARLLEPDYSIDIAAELLVSLRRELGERFSTFSWIAAYNAGAPAILRRGIFNAAYASLVHHHFLLYQVRALLAGAPA